MLQFQGGAAAGRGGLPEGPRADHQRNHRLYPRPHRVRAGASSTTRPCISSSPELQTEVELLRALAYRAAEALIAGEDVTRLASMAKLKGAGSGRLVPDACLHYWAAWLSRMKPRSAAPIAIAG